MEVKIKSFDIRKPRVNIGTERFLTVDKTVTLDSTPVDASLAIDSVSAEPIVADIPEEDFSPIFTNSIYDSTSIGQNTLNSSSRTHTVTISGSANSGIVAAVVIYRYASINTIQYPTKIYSLGSIEPVIDTGVEYQALASKTFSSPYGADISSSNHTRAAFDVYKIYIPKGKSAGLTFSIASDVYNSVGLQWRVMKVPSNRFNEVTADIVDIVQQSVCDISFLSNDLTFAVIAMPTYGDWSRIEDETSPLNITARTSTYVGQPYMFIPDALGIGDIVSFEYPFSSTYTAEEIAAIRAKMVGAYARVVIRGME